MPDGERAKPLIYREKAECKVSKALKDSEDLDLTYPQIAEKQGLSGKCGNRVGCAFDL